MTQIVLRKTARWNPALRNRYRERYAEHGGRYWKVSADSLDSMWWVEEVGYDGEAFFNGYEHVSPCGWAFNLSAARHLIARLVLENLQTQAEAAARRQASESGAHSRDQDGRFT